MERKNGDVALCPHFSEVPKTKNRDTGLPPHFSSGPKFKMTHYRNLTRISHRFVTIHNQVPLPEGEGPALGIVAQDSGEKCGLDLAARNSNGHLSNNR